MLTWFYCLTLSAVAQDISALKRFGATFFSLTELSRYLRFQATESTGNLTVRTPHGILIVFDGSPDVLWQPAAGSGPEDQSFSAPVIVEGGDWYAPEDLLQLFGIGLVDDALVLPGGGRLGLSFPQVLAAVSGDSYELIDLGNRVPALRYYAPGSAGPETISLLLVDLGLLALAYPEQQQQLDAFMSDIDRDRPLYFIVTGIQEGMWETSFLFQQGGVSLEVRYPFRVRLLEGEAGVVGPDRPVAGLILLPDEFNLRVPMRVTWSGVSAEVTFRR
ncbi:MAG: hypothetical protein JSV66_16785 [Trueperaceae bacterium]|nr:MAG: hypothetical protein JSV66_16785 [Trueperaceae bacterium]